MLSSGRAADRKKIERQQQRRCVHVLWLTAGARGRPRPFKQLEKGVRPTPIAIGPSEESKTRVFEDLAPRACQSCMHESSTQCATETQPYITPPSSRYLALPLGVAAPTHSGAPLTLTDTAKNSMQACAACMVPCAHT